MNYKEEKEAQEKLFKLARLARSSVVPEKSTLVDLIEKSDVTDWSTDRKEEGGMLAGVLVFGRFLPRLFLPLALGAVFVLVFIGFGHRDSDFSYDLLALEAEAYELESDFDLAFEEDMLEAEISFEIDMLESELEI